MRWHDDETIASAGTEIKRGRICGGATVKTSAGTDAMAWRREAIAGTGVARSRRHGCGEVGKIVPPRDRHETRREIFSLDLS